MPRQSNFRPAVVEALEDRVVLSRGGVVAQAAQGMVEAAGKHAKAPTGPAILALGDSYTDEYMLYRPERAAARNWVELLSTRGFSFGAFTRASRGEPRNQGFALNFARSDSTTAVLRNAQVPLAARAARAGAANLAVVFSGANDYLLFLRGAAALGVGASPEALAVLGVIEAQATANITTSVQTLLASSPRLRLVVATVPDFSLLPVVRLAALVDPNAQALLTAASASLSRYNDAIRGLAAASDRVALADLAALGRQLAASPPVVPVGGQPINLLGVGDDFRNFFTADGIHLGTVGQGFVANSFLGAANAEFGTRFALLSEPTIIRLARNARRIPR